MVQVVQLSRMQSRAYKAVVEILAEIHHTEPTVPIEWVREVGIPVDLHARLGTLNQIRIVACPYHKGVLATQIAVKLRARYKNDGQFALIEIENTSWVEGIEAFPLGNGGILFFQRRWINDGQNPLELYVTDAYRESINHALAT